MSTEEKRPSDKWKIFQALRERQNIQSPSRREAIPQVLLPRNLKESKSKTSPLPVRLSSPPSSLSGTEPIPDQDILTTSLSSSSLSSSSIDTLLGNKWGNVKQDEGKNANDDELFWASRSDIFNDINGGGDEPSNLRRRQFPIKSFKEAEDNWETESENSEDELSENFRTQGKETTSNEKYLRNFRLSNMCMSYTSLTDHLISQYRSEDDSDGAPAAFVEDTKDLPMDVKVPLMQVLDTLRDINKVLKVGQLTPRMERIMEYKEEHPFSDGYYEEKVGCCQWIVLKIEQAFKRFSESQWPY